MEKQLDKNIALQILKLGFERAYNKCEYSIKMKDFNKASWEFLTEFVIIFEEHGYLQVRKRIEVSKTIGFKTQKALKITAEIEVIRRIVEKAFMATLFDYPDKKSQ